MAGDALRVALLAVGIVAIVLGGPSSATGSEPVRLPFGAGPGSEESPHSVDTVVVEKGDHLWKISSRHLCALTGRPATNAETGPYWRTVIEVNRRQLRSGDPDLIYPGEVIELPDPG